MREHARRVLLLVGLFVSALGSAGCQGDEDCNSWAGAYGQSGWSVCGDKRERSVECDTIPEPGSAAPKPGSAVKCRCVLGGVVGKTFEMVDPSMLGSMESATKTANEQCGWNVGH